MKTVDRYILTRFLEMFVGSLTVVSFLFTALSVLDALTFLSRAGVSPGEIIRFHLLQLPQTIFMSGPVAALLSAMITFAGMNQHHELTALRAAGWSLARLSAPVIASGFFIAALMFILGNTLVPRGNRAFFSARQEALRRDDKDPSRRIWYVSESQPGIPLILRLGRLDPQKGEVHGITLFPTGPDFQLREQIIAPRALYDPTKGWRLLQAERRLFPPFAPPIITREAELITAIPETPTDLLTAQRPAEEMTWAELNLQIQRVHRYGLSETAYRVERHARLAIPLASVVLMLVGIPFAIRPVRSSGLAWGILAAVVIGFLYFVIIAELLAVGKGGLIAPWVAAWTANIIFGAAGLRAFLLLRR